MLHELAHMWFGDSVAPYEWSDVWLNEGHATWLVYGIEDLLRAQNGPPGQPLSGDPYDVFNINVYWGGALVLFALGEDIGTPAFEQLERAWVRKFRDGVASADDFIALASRVAGSAATS